MIPNISFSGTYKVNSKTQDSIEKFNSFSHYAISKSNPKRGIYTYFKDGFGAHPKNSFGHWEELTLIVPDRMNADVEEFCANKGIKFKKLENSYLLSTKTIKKRIISAPEGYTLVDVDVEKLEELAKNQDSNIEHCKNCYNNLNKRYADFTLKKGNKFFTAALSINGRCGAENLIDYIEKFGTKNFDDNQILVKLTSIEISGQTFPSPIDSMYFALKNLGMKKVPVYVDQESLAIGQKLGLF